MSLTYSNLTYSNPRVTAQFTDWPSGRSRTTCTFEIEDAGARGQRAVRTTVDPKTGRKCAPKKTTYAQRVRIVDGSDGRTYIVERISYGFISVRRSDFMQQELIWPHEARFAGIDNLLPKSFMQVTA